MAVIPLDELPQLTHQFDGLDTFIVGGWVRDKLRPDAEPSDVDLMVTGVSPEEMKERKFREIDSPNNETFGVFQDAFGREVALAREEASTGDGYRDFDIEPVDPSVDSREALRRDLRRRDFTVNAMAYSFDGVLYDPHGGVRDLKNGVIRHVDESAFGQDPLRIVRGARFAARLDADVDSETLGLMQSNKEKLTELPQERIRMEMEKAFEQAEQPSRFFDILNSIGALEETFPELDDLRGVPAGPEEWHEEGSAYRHTMLVLDEMAKKPEGDRLGLLMALCHDVGKANTDVDTLPSHHGHGSKGIPIIEDMAERLAFSNRQRRAAIEGAKHHMRLKHIDDMRSATVFDTYQEVHNLDRLLALMEADAAGRIPEGSFDRQLAEQRFSAAKIATKKITGQWLIDSGMDPAEIGGEQFGKNLRDRRIRKMKEMDPNA